MTFASTYEAMGEGHSFAPGDIVTFSATGATVPAFHVCVVAPSPPVFEPPRVITRGRPLTITWTGAEGATWFRFDADAVFEDLSIGWINCDAPADAGTMTIPASVTAMLANSPVPDIRIGARTERVIAAGQYEIHAAVFSGQFRGFVPVE